MKRTERDAIFRRWANEHAALIQHTARSFAGPAEVNDIIQEILLALWKAVPAFRGDSSPNTYIYRISQNAALDWQRRVRRHQINATANEEVACASTEYADERHSLYAAIRRLGTAERTLIAMHLAGHDYATIADTLGLSTGNVGARLTRLRQLLARQLGE